MAVAASIVESPALPAPERVLMPEDARAYRRFLEWSIGQGFKLAVIEVTTPSWRDALVAWTRDAFSPACLFELDQASGRPLRALLEKACPSPGGASVLLLTRLDEAEDRIKLCARLNVQRDELARDFPLPWVLFVHPRAGLDLVQHAPDFSDFASLWLREGEVLAVEAELPGGLSIEPQRSEIARLHAADRAMDVDLLAKADRAIGLSHYDEAADLLAQYDLRSPEARQHDARRIRLEGLLFWLRGQPDEALARFEVALGRCDPVEEARLRALIFIDIGHVLIDKGRPDEALRIYREEALPVFERLGDERSRAVTLALVAGISQARGQLDEALCIYREQVLPVFERLGDERERAMTLGQTADIAHARGELDEALRIYREQTLPVFERLGDERERTGTLGQIAVIYQARGELDEALRLYQKEVLPVYERLGDERARAGTLGRIASIHKARGELDEALRLYQEEVLPVYGRLGDERERAVTLDGIASIHKARGQLDEALRLYQEEVLPVFERLGLGRDLLLGRANLALLHLRRGHPEDRAVAAELLRLALHDAEALQLPEVAQLRAIQQQHAL